MPDSIMQRIAGDDVSFVFTCEVAGKLPEGAAQAVPPPPLPLLLRPSRVVATAAAPAAALQHATSAPLRQVQVAGLHLAAAAAVRRAVPAAAAAGQENQQARSQQEMSVLLTRTHAQGEGALLPPPAACKRAQVHGHGQNAGGTAGGAGPADEVKPQQQSHHDARAGAGGSSREAPSMPGIDDGSVGGGAVQQRHVPDGAGGLMPSAAKRPKVEVLVLSSDSDDDDDEYRY